MSSGFFNGLHGRYRVERSHSSQKSVATDQLIYKSVVFATKEVHAPAGRVTAAVNSLEVLDLQSDVVHSGAWRPLLDQMSTRKTAWPSVLINHDHGAGVGRVVNAWEGTDALYADMVFNMSTQAGRESFSNVAEGIYREWSVGFMPAPDGHEYDTKGIHHITKIGIWPEVSCVLIGASPNTRTLATKGWPSNRRSSVEELVNAGIDEIAARLAIPRDEAAAKFLETFGEKAEPPILAPSDQPFAWELDDPTRGREWRWDEGEKRWVRRVAESTWRVAPPAPRRAGETEPLDEALQRWVHGALPGQLPPK